MPEDPEAARPQLFGRQELTPEGLRALGELIASSKYPREPKSIAEALLRHIDPDSFWTLVASGDIHPLLLRPGS